MLNPFPIPPNPNKKPNSKPYFYPGLDVEEHQYHVIDDHGLDYQCRLTATGKVFCSCMRHLEYLLLCRHLCACVKHISREEVKLTGTHVFDPLWANPFWTTASFKKAHLHASRSHAVNVLQLKQRPLLPHVNSKVIDGRGRKAAKKRHLSKGEEGRHSLLQKKPKKMCKKHKTTTDLVLDSATFKHIQVALVCIPFISYIFEVGWPNVALSLY